MIRRNYHTHTTFCDGENTVEEMAAAAVARGMEALGFSGHSYVPHGLDYCMKEEDQPRYAAEVLAARQRYAGKLEIYLGIEDELHGPRPTFERDYTIGSVHALWPGNVYYSVDCTREIQRRMAREGYGGDFYRMTAAYYGEVAKVQEVTRCDIVGHFDLVAKFNEGNCLFDEDDPRYWKPAMEALEHLCRQGSVFEINTGAMVRGLRSAPYPSARLLRAIRDFGGAVVFSSDSHSAGSLCAHFPEAEALARECGFRTCRVLTPKGWEETPF